MQLKELGPHSPEYQLLLSNCGSYERPPCTIAVYRLGALSRYWTMFRGGFLESTCCAKSCSFFKQQKRIYGRNLTCRCSLLQTSTTFLPNRILWSDSEERKPSIIIILHSFRPGVLARTPVRIIAIPAHDAKRKSTCFPTFSVSSSTFPFSFSPTHQVLASRPYPQVQSSNLPKQIPSSLLQQETPSTAPSASAPHISGQWTTPMASTTTSATIMPTKTARVRISRF